MPRLSRMPDERIWCEGAGVDGCAVKVRRPFPWSNPNQYISLCDEKDREVFLIEDPDQLDAESRSVLDTALAEIGFVLEITALEAIDTEFEIRNWKVTTKQGPFVFQTKHEDWPIALETGGLLIRDIEGNLLAIRNPESLDEKSRKVLWAFLD